jgi:transcriptional regulator with XRE-family HTH domain
VKTLSSPLYRQFLVLMREARDQAGLSQVQLAERLGRPQSFISKYESGERRLDVAEFIEICRALDVSATKLLKKLVD